MPQTYLLLILIIIFWAVNLTLTKIGLQYISPTLFTLIRLITATIITFAFLFCRRKIVLPTHHDLPLILSIGLIQIGIVQVLITIGVSHIAVGRASILAYSTPLWATPAAMIFFREQITLFKLLGLALGMIGLIMLFDVSNFDWKDKNTIFGNIMILLASFCWTFALLHTRYGKWHRSPLELLPWQLLFSCLPPLFLLLINNNLEVQWNSTLLFILLYSGVIVMAFCSWASITINKQLPIIATSLSMLAVPVLSLILSAIVLKEAFTFENITATLLIIGGLTSIVLENKTANPLYSSKI